MLRNFIWLAITHIKRKKLSSILFFIMAFFISQSIFLISLSRTFLTMSDYKDIRQFFYTVIVAALIISILLLGALSFIFMSSRRHELGIMRIFGARKSDILLSTTLEIFFLSSGGAVLGILCTISLIFFRVLYLPNFFKETIHLKLIKLIGIGGQAVFSVILLETIFSLLMLSFLLHNDIKELVRGSS